MVYEICSKKGRSDVKYGIGNGGKTDKSNAYFRYDSLDFYIM